MSFPNIPDIDPHISITLEDAVNLLLTSIALEEVSLSKLIDAETCKILSILNDCKHRECDSCDFKHEKCDSHKCKHEDCVFHDALLINKSVDDTMQNIIKLQMLLQFKLEKVKDIIPTSSTTTTTSTSTTTTTTCTKTTTTKCTSSTTTTTCTTTCSTSTCSTTTKKPCRCCLTGKGRGCVENLCDEFNGQIAVLKAFVSCSDIKDRSIRYSVKKGDICLDFYAADYNVKIECLCKHPDSIMLYGKGRVEKKSGCDSVITDTAKFKLSVCNIKANHIELKMEIIVDTKPKLNHNSGTVQVKDHGSTLVLEIYR